MHKFDKRSPKSITTKQCPLRRQGEVAFFHTEASPLHLHNYRGFCFDYYEPSSLGKFFLSTSSVAVPNCPSYDGGEG